MRALFIATLLLLAGCNGTDPNIEGAPCTAPDPVFKNIACGYRLDAAGLHTRCAMECKRDLGRWVVQTCLAECGTGAFIVGEPGETGECYLPTVACAPDAG